MVSDYIELLKNPAHWLFELTLIFTFDIIIGLILWPWVKDILRHVDKHK